MNVGAHFTAVDLLLHVHTQQISVNYSLFYSYLECLPLPRIKSLKDLHLSMLSQQDKSELYIVLRNRVNAPTGNKDQMTNYHLNSVRYVTTYGHPWKTTY